ncbi:YciI family protein [Falsochrobactrum sp. TDYN1]|uniref:YciI family protein n=1 Tax=Falsochrobactrum tianjinense TaxID=2706015 RepID=A0A949PJK3_9HYPH|nr:YciI-like protein [Falsochrobactrum sp. TDYN1]MBV2141921.1 YciI family protein [Falsochrobactrum sp. TDYN1]
MLFAIMCNDKPDHLQVRLDTRPAHLDYLNGLGETLQFAGPFLDEDGKPNGSLVVVKAADKAQAEKIAANDPYALAGLFSDATICPWNWSINNPANA